MREGPQGEHQPKEQEPRSIREPNSNSELVSLEKRDGTLMWSPIPCFTPEATIQNQERTVLREI